MITDTDLKIIYITGNGRSGSTLLDIILGSSEECFSAGELINIARTGIRDEYCSCGRLIKECEIWSKVWDLWECWRGMSISEYYQLRWRYERNKVSLRALRNLWFPSQDFKNYSEATKQLYLAIMNVTGAKVIIDSSKTAQRIVTLKRIGNVRVIHLCRDFKGVLNSAKKSSKKNIKAGFEQDFPARSTLKTLLNWVINNFLSEVFCIGVESNKIRYTDLVRNPLAVKNLLVPSSTVENNYTVEHMLAGNVIRLKKNIQINPTLGFQYNRLNSPLKFMAGLVDKLCWYWS